MKRLRDLLRCFRAVAVRRRHALECPPQSLFDSVLLFVFAELVGLRFLQIGANDGVRADPIRSKVLRFGWQGLAVEPLPPLFERLRENYAGQSGIRFLNAAVDLTAGQRVIYFLHPGLEGLPDWAWGLPTFDRERLRKTAAELGLGEDAIDERTVATVTWSGLLESFGPAPCDVLVVDTEGYDLPLLHGAPLERWRPRVIHFEHSCASESERLSIYGRLIGLGYEIATQEGDTIAWRREPAAPVGN